MNTVTEAAQEGAKLVCSYCGEEVDGSDDGEGFYEAPDDGSPVCNECYEEHFQDACALCAEYFDNSDVTGQKEVFIFGTSSLYESHIDSKKMPPGLYRVTSYPYYSDGMICMFLFESSFERIGDLFRSDPPDFDGFPMGKICPDCLKKRVDKAEAIAKTGVERMELYEWRNMLGRQQVAPEHHAFRCPSCGHVQSATTLMRSKGLALEAAVEESLSTCETCGFSVTSGAGYKVEVCKPNGEVVPAFAPVTPEGAQRFMAGGKKPQCRCCEHDYLPPDGIWKAPDLCSACAYDLEKNAGWVCSGCGRTHLQVRESHSIICGELCYNCTYEVRR